jgi:hypothetical protein
MHFFTAASVGSTDAESARQLTSSAIASLGEEQLDVGRWDEVAECQQNER